MADAASLMTETISDFNNPGGSAGEGTPPVQAAPEPAPSTAPAPGVSQAQGAEAGAEGQTESTQDGDPNWYETLLAAEDNDPFKALLLDDTAWQSLRQNPQQVSEYATNARQLLQQRAQAEEDLKQLNGDFEYVGGRDNARFAARLVGDLFRGEDALSEEDALRWGANGPRTHVDRALFTLLSNKETAPLAGDLGAAVLTHMPGLIRANEDFLLQALGYDPKFKADFKNVIQSGGFQPQVDTEGVRLWFEDNQIPIDRLATFQRLPLKAQQDLTDGNVEASKFHLERYHKDFQREDRETADAQTAESQREQQANETATRTLAESTAGVYEDYVQKGVALGLNPLEAAGAAALAYKQIESGYWEQGSESRNVFDNWYNKLRGGNKFQADQAKSSYQKTFEKAWRVALGQHKPKRPGLPASPSGRQPVAPPNGQPNQFQPVAAPGQAGLTGVDLMNEILRQHGAIQ